MIGSTRYELARNRIAEREGELARAAARQERLRNSAGETIITRGGTRSAMVVRRLRALMRPRAA